MEGGGIHLSVKVSVVFVVSLAFSIRYTNAGLMSIGPTFPLFKCTVQQLSKSLRATFNFSQQATVR